MTNRLTKITRESIEKLLETCLKLELEDKLLVKKESFNDMAYGFGIRVMVFTIFLF